MSVFYRLHYVRLISAVGGMLLTSGCKPDPQPGPAPLPVKPTCTVSVAASDNNFISWNGRVFIAERTDPNILGGFTPFRPARGPLSNPAITFTNTSGIPDCFAMNEVWLRKPGSNEVHRSLLTPGIISGPGGIPRTTGASWRIHTQDPFGTWRLTDVGRPNADIAAPTQWPAPPLMFVGEAFPRVFTCVTGRSYDGQVTTTHLAESPSAAAGSGGLDYIQDVLNGDDRFVPNAPGPLIGPATPPSPTISGPGDPVREGAVMCAMTQNGDVEASRALHLISTRDKKLRHAMLSDFGPVTAAGGSGTTSRFRSVTPWGDVLTVLGLDPGEVVSAAALGRLNNLHLFFVGKKDGRFKLWHTARFASGSWLPARDVFAVSGEAPNGFVYSFSIAIGACQPMGAVMWDEQETEIVVALAGMSDGGVYTLSYVRSPRVWFAGGPSSVYSQVSPIRNGDFDTSHFLPWGVSVAARPFED